MTTTSTQPLPHLHEALDAAMALPCGDQRDRALSDVYERIVTAGRGSQYGMPELWARWEQARQLFSPARAGW